MAYRAARQVNSGYVTGNLARKPEQPARERRDYVRGPAPRRRVVAPPKHRERIRVSNAVVLGFLAAAAA
ncbi:MAG: hypothetical protein IJT71_01985, partial [Oscillospiraceae bacterium]|nr:hypothetical protein [Oscillospiraceae bacterium]